MILKSFCVFGAMATLPTKYIHTKIKEESVKDEIVEKGLYHVTSDEAADKIMESGYIKPTGIVGSYSLMPKVFTFKGIPSIDLIKKNLPLKMNPMVSKKYEIAAIKLNPNKEELNKYRQRIFNDGSVEYNGKCNLPSDRSTRVQLVIDLDKDKNLVYREKTDEEIEIGEYIPSDECKEIFESEISKTSVQKEWLEAAKLETTMPLKIIANKIMKIFNRESDNKKLLSSGLGLDEKINSNIDSKSNEKGPNDMINMLEKNVYLPDQVQYVNNDEQERNNKDEIVI